MKEDNKVPLLAIAALIVFVIVLAACTKQPYIQPKAVTLPEEATVSMAVPVIPVEVIEELKEIIKSLDIND